jgi:hypothetical protein
MSWLVACSSRSVSDFGSRSDSNWWSCMSWVLTRGVTQPGPRAPLVSFSHSISPAQQPPSPSPTSLSPCGALGFGDSDRRSLDPAGEFPSPSLSLSSPPPLLLLPCAPLLLPPSTPPPPPAARLPAPAPGGGPAPRLRPRARGPPARLRPAPATRPLPRCAPVPATSPCRDPVRPRAAPGFPVARPSRALAAPPDPTPHAPRRAPWSRARPRPLPCPRPCPRAPLPCPSPCPGLTPRAPARFARPWHAQRALARATVVARRSTLVLIHFNFSLVDMLRRALSRATVHSKFIFINVLYRALRRATIHFKFIFIKVLCRVLRRATIRFKFSSVDVMPSCVSSRNA